MPLVTNPFQTVRLNVTGSRSVLFEVISPTRSKFRVKVNAASGDIALASSRNRFAVDLNSFAGESQVEICNLDPEPFPMGTEVLLQVYSSDNPREKLTIPGINLSGISALAVATVSLDSPVLNLTRLDFEEAPSSPLVNYTTGSLCREQVFAYDGSNPVSAPDYPGEIPGDAISPSNPVPMPIDGFNPQSDISPRLRILGQLASYARNQRKQQNLSAPSENWRLVWDCSASTSWMRPDLELLVDLVGIYLNITPEAQPPVHQERLWIGSPNLSPDSRRILLVTDFPARQDLTTIVLNLDESVGADSGDLKTYLSSEPNLLVIGEDDMRVLRNLEEPQNTAYAQTIVSRIAQFLAERENI